MVIVEEGIEGAGLELVGSESAVKRPERSESSGRRSKEAWGRIVWQRSMEMVVSLRSNSGSRAVVELS